MTLYLILIFLRFFLLHCSKKSKSPDGGLNVDVFLTVTHILPTRGWQWYIPDDNSF